MNKDDRWVIVLFTLVTLLAVSLSVFAIYGAVRIMVGW